MKKYAMAVAFAAVMGVVALPASPASASTPQCTTSKVMVDVQGDAQIVVPVSASGSDNCWLAQGDVSSAVGALQNALKSCEGPQFRSLAVDNNYGPNTKAAVKAVQTDFVEGGAHIAIDGVYGPDTKHYLSFAAVGGGCGGDAP